MLRNAAFLPASEAGRVLSTLQMSARQNRQHRPLAETGSHLATTIRPLIAAVQQKLGNVVWNPDDRGYYINGVKHDRSEFLSLLQAAGSSAEVKLPACIHFRRLFRTKQQSRRIRSIRRFLSLAAFDETSHHYAASAKRI